MDKVEYRIRADEIKALSWYNSDPHISADEAIGTAQSIIDFLDQGHQTKAAAPRTISGFKPVTRARMTKAGEDLGALPGVEAVDFPHEKVKYSNFNDVYVGGNQTYTVPASVPSTAAALYDTSKTKVDEKTLTSSDWNDIARKLKEPSGNQSGSKGGDFAFIQNNNESADNGHWMLLVGFSLISVSLIGFVTLIVRASKRKKAAVANSYRMSNSAYVQRDRRSYDDDFDIKPKKAKKSKKSKSGGTRYR